MKKLFLFCLTFAAAVFTGCNDDDDPPPFGGYISVDGVQTAANGLYIIYYGGDNTDGYNYLVIPVTGNANPLTQTGTGKLVVLDLYNLSATSPAGAYLYTGNDVVGELSSGSWYGEAQNNNIIDQTGFTTTAPRQASIGFDGENYLIEFDLTAADGRSIYGYYYGPVTEFADYSAPI